MTINSIPQFLYFVKYYFYVLVNFMINKYISQKNAIYKLLKMNYYFYFQEFRNQYTIQIIFYEIIFPL